MKEHKLAALISYLSLFLTCSIGIFITPVIIKGIGNSEYGLYSLVGAFTGYLTILDFGLSHSIIRYIAEYRVRKDRIKEENFLAVSLGLYFIIGMLIAIAGSIFYSHLDHLLGKTLTVTELEKARIMVSVLIFNFAVTVPGAAFTAISSGYEKFVFPRALMLVKYILRSVLVYLIVKAGTDSVALVILDTVINVFFILFSAGYVFWGLHVKIRLHNFDIRYLGSVLGYSFWVFLYGVLNEFQWRSGQVILGITTTTEEVAVFSVAVLLSLFYTTFGGVINGLLLPKTIQYIHQGSDLTDKAIKVARLSLTLLLYLFGAFLLTGRLFVKLWLGEPYNPAWIIALLIMAAYIIPTSLGLAHAVLEARKQLRFKSTLLVILTLSGLAAGYMLSFQHKGTGMMWGQVSAFMVFNLVMCCYYHFRTGIDMIRFFKKTYIKITVPFTASVIMAYLVNPYFPENWTGFFIKNLVYSIFFLVFIGFYLNNEERKLGLSLLKL